MLIGPTVAYVRTVLSFGTFGGAGDPQEGLLRALVCGISGQDGAYLARLLLDKGYEVIGTSRDAQIGGFPNLVRLGVRDHVRLESMAANDFRSVLNVLRETEPQEIYNLAGQSSVGLSFEQPVETLDSMAVGTINLLEAIRFLDKPVRFYSAGSSECFGDTEGQPANEQTPFRPRSPYAVAKSTAHWLVANYREAYGLHASTGILFNHESPLRPERFVTKKIVAAAVRIAKGERSRLTLGNIAIKRDWGWAPEYVDAMWRMLQQPSGSDFVIATGQSHTLEEFAQTAFNHLGLDWREHTDLSEALRRPSDLTGGLGDASRARDVLGWSPTYRMHDVVKAMVEAEHTGVQPL
ncbi:MULTISPECIES: GDP-mannose 4,6-dehydratase [Mycobacterium avium complex (MAC)]|uniref:GDP-mannose 4,6-dehydratase n=1 Tax=Mycobacterium avium complex (MAC) TaxID=120793 RepID=UPI000312E5EC|nr:MULTISPECIES: GDP-mannose 4,6-dehydratase [Mycobacterium avium complex (MAC)]MDM3895974.1 GDP-mannose 4,6-dehydratase [Mycobacterium intracellulare]UGU04120.1 GDP-mannose 4,6-dehydratase [Mycobacterium intracellulare]